MFHNLSVSRGAACNFPGSGGVQRRAGTLLAGLVAGFAFCAPTGASAASCTNNIIAGNAAVTGVFAAGVAGAVTSAVTNSNLAFLSGTEAYVAGGGSGAQPDQMGGGVWSRAVGGDLDYKQTSTTNVTGTLFPGPTPPGSNGTVNCNSTV